MFDSNSVVGRIKLKRFLRYACSILLFYVPTALCIELIILFVTLTLNYLPSFNDTFHISDQTKNGDSISDWPGPDSIRSFTKQQETG